MQFCLSRRSYLASEDASEPTLGYTSGPGEGGIMSFKSFDRKFSPHILDWVAFAVMTTPSLMIPFALWYSSKSKYDSMTKSKKQWKHTTRAPNWKRARILNDLDEQWKQVIGQNVSSLHALFVLAHLFQSCSHSPFPISTHPALAVIVSKRNCYSSKDLFWIKSFTSVNGFQLTVPSFHVLTKCFWSKCASYFCARSKSQKYGEKKWILPRKSSFIPWLTTLKL